MFTYITSVCPSRRTSALQALLHPSGRHVPRTAGPRPPRSGVKDSCISSVSREYILIIVSTLDGYKSHTVFYTCRLLYS